jgi:trimethylamine---corrinoid protein Co-methyltransferase
MSFAAVTDGEIAAIDQVSRGILEETGVRVAGADARLLDELEGLGLAVDHGTCVARFPAALIADALRSVPGPFTVHDRSLTPVFTLGAGHPPRFASGFNATFDCDFSTGVRRPAGVADVAEYARIAQGLDAIDVVGPQLVPQDVPSPTALLHAVAAVLENTDKPVLFAPENDHEAEGVLQILKAAADVQDLGEKPAAICQFSPSSPLFWNADTLRGFLRVVREGLPCTILPGPLAGATSPYTLAANLAQKNAEMLSGLVIAQRACPGARLLAYNGGGQFEMRSQCAVFGTPEIALILMAGTGLAHFYGLPAHACIPCSDSHLPDEQLGWENGLLYMAGLSAGTDLFVNAGMFASGETASREQLVIDAEMIAVLRRLLRGMAVDQEHLCRDALRRAGPHGSFLDDPSTVEHLRSGEWSSSPLWERRRFEHWQTAGSPSVPQKAEAMVRNLLGKEGAPLPERTRREIRSIIRAREEER